MSRADQLVDLVGREIALDLIDYQTLQQHMSALHQQLLMRAVAEIDATNESISTILERIGARADRRSKILSAFGLPLDASGSLRELLMRAPAENRPALLAQLTQLEASILETKQQNERNGKLLAMHNDILTQVMSASTSGATYQPRYY